MKSNYTDKEWADFSPEIRWRTFEESRVFASQEGVIHLFGKQLSYPQEIQNQGYWNTFIIFSKCNRAPLFFKWITNVKELEERIKSGIFGRCKECGNPNNTKVYFCKECGGEEKIRKALS